MARPNVFPADELAEHLKDIPTWRHEGNTIVQEIACSDFAAAVGLVNSIAILAEKMDHHPDLLIHGWNKVRVTLSTHDQGGLTTLDIELAKQINALSIDTLS